MQGHLEEEIMNNKHKPLAFGSNECSDNVAQITSGRLSILFNILVTFFANGGGASLAGLLELCTTVRTLDDWKRSSTILECKRKWHMHY